MPEIPRDELAKIPYYDGQDLHGRVVQLRNYYDAEEDDWYWYRPVEGEKLGRMGGGEVVRGAYFAEEPADGSRDVPFPLGTFVARYASWGDVAVVTRKMETDLLQLASLFGKLDLITEAGSFTDIERSALLESEIEHLVTVSRSFYDLLQKFSKRMAAKAVDREDLETRVFQDLPDSFADVALNSDDEPRSAEEIIDSYGLTEELANFYASEADTFATLRAIRVGLTHHGKRPPTSFVLEEGPAIAVTGEPWSDLPWSDLPIWEESELIRDRLGSVRALTAAISRRCLNVTTRYLQAFTTRVAVPAPLIADVTLYLRGPFTDRLNSLDEIVFEPWN